MMARSCRCMPRGRGGGGSTSRRTPRVGGPGQFLDKEFDVRGECIDSVGRILAHAVVERFPGAAAAVLGVVVQRRHGADAGHGGGEQQRVVAASVVGGSAVVAVADAVV